MPLTIAALFLPRDLSRQHALCRFGIDQRVSVKMCGDDVRPLIEDTMQRIVVFDVEDRNGASPDASVDVPAYTALLVA